MTIVQDRLTRQEIVDALLSRDGNTCQFPGCDGIMDFSLMDGPQEVTIDHWIPQHFGKSNNWTYEEIWALSNLKLMHKKCNAKKGDRVPDENGILPEKIVRKFRYRRDKRAERADACTACDNGHELLIGEVCASCGCDAQRFPRYAKAPKAADCDHDIMWCAWCSIGVIPRVPAHVGAMRQAESGEEDGLYGE